MTRSELRRLFAMVLATVFVFSTAAVVENRVDMRAAQQANEAALAAALVEAEAVPAAQEPAAPTLPALPVFPLPEDGAFLADLALDSLRQTNPDVLGWLHIPGSVISYPLMRSHDNDEYLHHTWDGTPNVAGAIFLEQHNSADFTDFNTIIYGHNMADGSMFGELHKYRWQDVPEKYPYVYIALDNMVLRYEIFAAYTAHIASDTYRLSFADEAAKDSAADFYKASSQVTLAPMPTAEDHILTLSTCTGSDANSRWVLQTVLTGILPR